MNCGDFESKELQCGKRIVGEVNTGGYKSTFFSLRNEKLRKRSAHFRLLTHLPMLCTLFIPYLHFGLGMY